MKYFCISDVHGEYEKMIAALKEVGFNKETDTLVSVGDLFDRGLGSDEVLEYVMSCPHRLLCMGNHDLRLMKLILDPCYFNQYDIYNGVRETLACFDKADYIGEVWSSLMRLRENKLLKQYFHECRAAYEFSNLIITHGWIPYNKLSMNRYEPFYRILPGGITGDWRKARANDWEEAMWAHTEMLASAKLFPKKPLLIGHWHAWRLAEKYGEKRQTNKHLPDKDNIINCDTFKYYYKDELKFIAIDGCANWPYGGKVNVYVFESDEEPEPIFGGLGTWYY